MSDKDYDDLNAKLAESRSYAQAVNVFRKAWAHIYPLEPLEISGESARAQHGSCMVQLKAKMQSPAQIAKWQEYYDLPAGHDVVKVIETVKLVYRNRPVTPTLVADIDDITPNQFKTAVYEVARLKAKSDEIVTVGLPDFLRACLKEVFREGKLTGQLNVGPNRHFSRMYKWLKEVADETDWNVGRGIKVGNVGGRGPVAANPFDPKKLKIAIDAEYLPKLRSKASKLDGKVISKNAALSDPIAG